ncbi:UDP-N-acetylglucosamine 2-epimerase [Alphaproteobacteria bacterium]|nr:UDP-N-acetylglucosamine 2-epimerase [Alphaproteobacteria bacterium]
MRKVLIFTGNRAEYGLLYSLIKELEASPLVDCSLLVSGAHMDLNHGATISEIENDGFKILATLDLSESKGTELSTTIAIGSAITGIAKILDNNKPDIFVVYADRFEGFAAVVAATQMSIVTCHIEGGDITEGGALDDNLRHAMTKLSHIHCATNEEAMKRILSLGEEKWRVHNIGYPAIDLIRAFDYLTQNEILDEFNFNIDQPIILFTQHSIATEVSETRFQIDESIKALCFMAEIGAQVICTYPNNDAGGKIIINRLNSIPRHYYPFFLLEPSLGRRRYHGILALALKGFKVICVGNTSSGIKETAAFKCPSVNIGSRQKGRLHSNNVIHVSYNKQKIVDAIQLSCGDNEFTRNLSKINNPYGTGNSGKKFRKIIENITLGKKVLQKKITI